ncbi:MAG: cytochrome c oxidase assembly protein [Solirubrobacterales bacterium]|nr:cytochrome c oxidase assembly protein [Solirubrobacterales bacterium]
MPLLGVGAILAAVVVTGGSLSGHMLAHVLLIDVAPPLLLAGAKVRSARPLLCMAFYWLVLALWHVPPVFNTAMTSAPLHGLEEASFLLAGLALWWPLHSPKLGALGRLVYALVAMLPMDALGAYLNRTPHLIYMGTVADQQHAGALMWVGSTTVMTVGGLWACLLALQREERDQQARDTIRAD